jgi:hypothetical protein
MLWPQNFKKYNLLCWDEGDFCLGGLVVCRWGELGLERRRRNRGGEGRQRGHILTFPTVSPTENPSVIPSAILTETSTRHRTDLPFLIPQWFHRNFKRWTGHVTVRICHFESLGDSIGILNGEPVTSLYEVVVLNPSVISSEKITPPKPPRQRPAFFLIRNVFRP